MDDRFFLIWHVANHRIVFLWRFHNVYHIDPDLDVSTAFRFHFVEVGFSAAFRVAQVLLIGPSLAAYVIYELFFQLGTLFHHSNVRMPLSVERALNTLFVTPRMHGIHHSNIRDEDFTNFGVVFPWWDRLHGTLRLNIPQAQLTIGIPGWSRPEDNRVLRSFAMPYRDIGFWERPTWASVRNPRRSPMAAVTETQRFAFALAVSAALASIPALAQQRDLPRQPPSEPMQGMMQERGMMDMMPGMMMGATGDAGRERPQLTIALQNRAELALTEAQVKALEGLTQRFRGSAEKGMREIQSAETQLAALLKQDAAAGAQVEANVRAIEKLRADLRLERIRTIAEGRAVLAVEQRAKLDQLAAASGAGMTGMGHGNEGGSSRPERKH